MTISGHCLCKSVTFKIEDDAVKLSGADHCDDCMRQTGSVYSWVLVVPKDQFIVSGHYKSYDGAKGDSGNVVHRWFCPKCGSPIAHWPDGAPVIAVKAGLLEKDQRKNFPPGHDVYGKDKLDFVPITAHFHEMMP